MVGWQNLCIRSPKRWLFSDHLSVAGFKPGTPFLLVWDPDKGVGSNTPSLGEYSHGVWGTALLRGALLSQFWVVPGLREGKVDRVELNVMLNADHFQPVLL